MQRTRSGQPLTLSANTMTMTVRLPSEEDIPGTLLFGRLRVSARGKWANALIEQTYRVHIQPVFHQRFDIKDPAQGRWPGTRACLKRECDLVLIPSAQSNLRPEEFAKAVTLALMTRRRQYGLEWSIFVLRTDVRYRPDD